jgi:hypothetical protein
MSSGTHIACVSTHLHPAVRLVGSASRSTVQAFHCQPPVETSWSPRNALVLDADLETPTEPLLPLQTSLFSTLLNSTPQHSLHIHVHFHINNNESLTKPSFPRFYTGLYTSRSSPTIGLILPYTCMQPSYRFLVSSPFWPSDRALAPH